MGHVVLGAEPIRSHVCFVFGHGNVEFVRVGATVCTSDCGAWCVVRGAWCVVRGAWCVVRGAWCVVRGAWCVVR